MKKVEAYLSDCGKLYKSKSGALKHDKSCWHWTNPNLKTCFTCKFGTLQYDSNGMEHEPQLLHKWAQWDCSNKNFDYDLHFNNAQGDNTKSLCINCPVWEAE